LTLYLDTSVIVPLFIAEAFSLRAEALLLSGPHTVALSDYSELEFASAVSRRVRIGDVRPRAARAVLANFDSWAARNQRTQLTSADLTNAKGFLHRLDLPLKTGDAIQIAIARRIGAALMTFDAQMARSAATLGIPVAQ
jgi:predicted nucleic acid-binding protein